MGATQLDMLPIGQAAPCAWSIDKRQDDAHNSCHDDNGPEYTTYIAPHSHSSFAPASLTQLNAKHGEDKEYHEQAEPKGSDKLWYRTMWRIL